MAIRCGGCLDFVFLLRTVGSIQGKIELDVVLVGNLCQLWKRGLEDPRALNGNARESFRSTSIAGSHIPRHISLFSSTYASISGHLTIRRTVSRSTPSSLAISTLVLPTTNFCRIRVRWLMPMRFPFLRGRGISGDSTGRISFACLTEFLPCTSLVINFFESLAVALAVDGAHSERWFALIKCLQCYWIQVHLAF